MVRNRIYNDLFNFKCPKRDNKTLKQCSGKLHPTNTYRNTLEFICNTCQYYTTMDYEKANLIVNDTGKAPQAFRSQK